MPARRLVTGLTICHNDPVTARGDIAKTIEEGLGREQTSSPLAGPSALAPTRKPVGMSLPTA
jgi:hypothetical protein